MHYYWETEDIRLLYTVVGESPTQKRSLQNPTRELYLRFRRRLPLLPGSFPSG